MELSRPVGELAPCPRCGGQPKLIETRGREQFRTECPPCRVRLWDVPSAAEAIACWEGLPRPATEPTERRDAA